jgi:hypothetical protein
MSYYVLVITRKFIKYIKHSGKLIDNEADILLHLETFLQNQKPCSCSFCLTDQPITKMEQTTPTNEEISSDTTDYKEKYEQLLQFIQEIEQVCFIFQREKTRSWC